jgi:nucleotide-binding universal stress UspA family protein
MTVTTDTNRSDGLHLVLATDGSAGAALALDMLLDLPLGPRDRVTVVTHPTFFLAARPNGDGIVSRLAARQRDRARAIVKATLARLIERGIRVDGVVQDGEDAVDAIVRAATSRKADLVVVGSRGHGAVASLLIGSTARTLAILCPVPILIVRGPGKAPQRVLLAYDGSPAARAALALLRRLPLPREATVVALNVIPPRTWPELGADDDDALDLRVRIEREDLTSAESVVGEAALPFGDGAVRPIIDARAGRRNDPPAITTFASGPRRHRVARRGRTAPAVLGEHSGADHCQRRLHRPRCSRADPPREGDAECPRGSAGHLADGPQCRTDADNLRNGTRAPPVAMRRSGHGDRVPSQIGPAG